MPYQPKIKICGITNIADARAAVESGADFIGLNFYRKSPRYIDVVEAAKIVRSLKQSVKIVGVFVNERADIVCETARSLAIDAIQLHGDETLEFAASVAKAADITLIKAVRIGPNSQAPGLPLQPFGYFLLDALADGVYGGSGLTIDWRIARDVSLHHKNIFLAGGLTPDNVKNAIEIVHPFAVDVCSSIECLPGKKDHQKMKQFIEAVKLG